MIDCDVHADVPKVEALFPYLPKHWVEHVNQTVFKGPTESPYPKNAPTSFRPGSRDEDERPPDLDRVREQVLDRVPASGCGVELAILNCSYGIDSLRNPDAAVAFASAVNDWLIAEWLEKEPRLRGSMVVPSQLPEPAAREIRRVGGHRGFVQVYLPVRSQHPYGSRLFHPMWEAIAELDLVAGIHFGGAPGNPPFPSGWPSYYFEEWAGMAQVFQSQVVSIVSEGVFDRFPAVRVALIEGGFTWVPTFMWRFDKEWRNLRRLVPWVKQAPSEYMRQHVRLTIQPLDAPPTRTQMHQVIDQIGSDEMLMYASDYPHVHASDPVGALLPDLPEPLARKIRSENARALYRLSAER
ncbi:MAG TPA: amidohydrolase family protein [Chloroflexota bacterium]|nr:amidohydrolase family protein [Chloroflexota bacterium]